MLISSYYSWQFIWTIFWTWKWRHDDTETSFDFTSVDFYLLHILAGGVNKDLRLAF